MRLGLSLDVLPKKIILFYVLKSTILTISKSISS